MSKHSVQPLLVSAPAGAGLPQYYQGPPTYQTIAVPIEVHPVRYRRSPLRRFLVAFFVTIGIWVTLKTLLVHHIRHGHEDWDWYIPSDMVLEQCVSGSAWGTSAAALTGDFSAGASFEIPLSVDTVLLLSSYRKSSFFSTHSMSGTLDVTTSDQFSDSAKVIIHSFDGMRTDGNIRVCLMTGTDGKIGVGIFRKGSWWDTRSATFMKITLVLPATAALPQVEGLEVDLPNFSINVGNLKDTVDFKSVSLKTTNAAVKVDSFSAARVLLQTSNARIDADSLVSADLTLKTSNAPITGTFNTSDSLHITTSNSPINVAVGLESNNKAKPTVLIMRTSNNRLDAKVTLSTKAHMGGRYSVLGRTSNGPLAISIPGSPVESELHLNALTSNAAAEVKLHNTYQGAFGVSTSSQWSARVTRLDQSDDDSRHLHFDSNRKGEVGGSIFAKEGNKGLGEVRVRTSNAQAVLFV
ncbi:hypothetical protein C8F04DRAFT_1127596 [Mycena alexandri]|uniref:Uncharacterized protein n=1 Tax=Mycena alexandri TaxID=1745969 RepID=A0AAD6SD03_9AGAR|nr:hypothetical protein C8F04DRAFT_1127596 [Mycena alexandri]